MALTWDKSFSVGDASLDDQHKQIFQKVSVLEQAVKKGTAAEHVFGLLDFLDEYAFYHFHYEERYMQAHNFPGLEEHKKAHQGLANELKELIEKFHKTHDDSLINDLLTFVQRWLKGHVLIVDKKFSDFIDSHKDSHPAYETKNYHTIIH